MGLLGFLQTSIQPRVTKTSNTLSLVPIEPTRADWAYITFLLLGGCLLLFWTTDDWIYRAGGVVLYCYLAYTLVQDVYVATLNKEKNEVRIQRSTLGVTRYERVAPLDELVAIETVAQKEDKKSSAPGYRLELEFMSDFGYYRLPVTETFILGEKNRMELEKLEDVVRKFAKISKLPDALREENLEKSAARKRAAKRTPK
ncbi:hypothetical protein HDU85_001036 [Gaertneriomyces sp. JEL0708]|nr:hypothetical protein HDU85_001036 [Gaertneriomyces sp. JEL0708]